MMTEKEARKKWCPFARDRTTAGNRAYPTSLDDRDYRCIASDCMAWRSVEEWLQVRRGANPPTGFVFAHKGDDELGMDAYVKRRGYCGLAGAP